MSVAENNIKKNGELTAATGSVSGETARTRRRGAREQVILGAARLLMSETGYEAMTMDDLAARAHVSKPTLYQYFPSKESVAVRAIVGLMQESHDYFNDLDTSLPAVVRLETFVRWVLTQRFTPCRVAFGAAKTALAPVVRSHPEYQKEFARLVVAVGNLVEQAKTENDLAHNLSTRIVVQMVFSLLRDSEYDLLVASGECSENEIVSTLSALFLCGIGQCPTTKEQALPLPLLPDKRDAAFSPDRRKPLEPTK